MVEVYVFHDSLLYLTSFLNLTGSFLNLIKFSVVGCFFSFVKSVVAFFLNSLAFFVPLRNGMFFFCCPC